MQPHHRNQIKYLLLSLFWGAAAAWCLSGCSPTPPSALAALDATTPKTATTVDLGSVSRPLDRTGKSIERMGVTVDNSKATIAELERDLLAAKSNTEKLTALANLLRRSASNTEDQMAALADDLQAVTDKAERDRLRNLVTVSELKTHNTELSKELANSKYSHAHQHVWID